MNQLQQLKQWTRIAADTGNAHSLSHYQPHSVTTNPTLLRKAAEDPFYEKALHQIIIDQKINRMSSVNDLAHAADQFTLHIAHHILKHIPGDLSLEVDAHLSFSRERTYARAMSLLAQCAQEHIDPQRILIKIAATWEGIQAAQQLEKEGIRCNLTLIFSEIQALACADAGAFLVSPFIGRITDWYKKTGTPPACSEEDPGVSSVRTIYTTLKSRGYSTIIMGASFRHIDQVTALAGCDYLTLSPSLLEALQKEDAPIKQQLTAEDATVATLHHVNEENFRWKLNENPMATEKLSEGIRLFNQDTQALFQCLKQIAESR